MVLDLFRLVDDLVGKVVGLQQRDGAAALHLLIDLMIVDRAAAADDAKDRDGMAQIQRAISPVQVRSPVLPMIATERTPPKNAPAQIAMVSASRPTGSGG